jgi:hypothetical protein
VKIKRDLGLETRLAEGRPGEFSVSIAEEKVIEKGWFFLPSGRKVLEALRAKIGAGSA